MTDNCLESGSECQPFPGVSACVPALEHSLVKSVTITQSGSWYVAVFACCVASPHPHCFTDINCVVVANVLGNCRLYAVKCHYVAISPCQRGQCMAHNYMRWLLCLKRRSCTDCLFATGPLCSVEHPIKVCESVCVAATFSKLVLITGVVFSQHHLSGFILCSIQVPCTLSYCLQLAFCNLVAGNWCFLSRVDSLMSLQSYQPLT